MKWTQLWSKFTPANIRECKGGQRLKKSSLRAMKRAKHCCLDDVITTHEICYNFCCKYEVYSCRVCRFYAVTKHCTAIFKVRYCTFNVVSIPEQSLMCGFVYLFNYAWCSQLTKNWHWGWGIYVITWETPHGYNILSLVIKGLASTRPVVFWVQSGHYHVPRFVHQSKRSHCSHSV